MVRHPTIRNGITLVATWVALFTTAGWAQALEPVGGLIDLGFGGGAMRPQLIGDAAYGTVGLEISMRGPAPARWLLELRTHQGGEFSGGVSEGPNAGTQSIVTVLGGVQLVERGTLQGWVLSTGLGVGHARIRAARGPLNAPNYGAVPLRNRTGVAYGLGLAYRFANGPGPTLVQFAIRTHRVLDDDGSEFARATVLTLGFAF